MLVRWYYHPEYDYARKLPLPKSVHGFLRDRPTRIYREILARGIAGKEDFVLPEPIDELWVGRVHSESVVRGLSQPRELAKAIEFPALAMFPKSLARGAIVEPQILAAGGTHAAMRAALDGNWAINLSGGYHHARPDLSHGFCLINDVAIGIDQLNQEHGKLKILILDLDLHQGDGNSVAFAGRKDVFTASIHQESAFPVPKAHSDLDVGLPDGTEDASYLSILGRTLDEVFKKFKPELVVYIAGTDPFVEDSIGELSLSKKALVERDRCVAERVSALGVGMVVLPAGGYTSKSPEIAARGFRAIAQVAGSV